MVSKAVLNAQKELLNRRHIDGVAYRVPQLVSSEVPFASSKTLDPVDTLPLVDRVALSYDPGTYSPPSYAPRASAPAASIDVEPADDKPIPAASESGAQKLAEREIFIVGDILAECIKQKRLSPLKLYLALRLIDYEGSGIVYKADARAALDGHMGKRYFNQIVQDGQLFWQLTEAHQQPAIKLSGTVKLWSEIGTENAKGKPVRITWADLFGEDRNHFRRRIYELSRESLTTNRPVTRRKLQDIIGVGKSTQRRYDRHNETHVQKNIVLGDKLSDRSRQKARAEGRACFDFVDSGRKGEKQHRQYIAWWQGNSYQSLANVTDTSRKRRRRLNRQLACLWINRTEGQTNDDTYTRLFHDNPATAGDAYNRDATRDALYPVSTTPAFGYWHQLDGIEPSMLVMLQGGN